MRRSDTTAALQRLADWIEERERIEEERTYHAWCRRTYGDDHAAYVAAWDEYLTALQNDMI